MKSPAYAVVIAGAVAAVTVPAAQASPPPGFDDPHIPNMMMGNCLGGKGGLGSISYCDGERYADGSYWHQLLMMQGWLGPTVTMNCVVDNGSPIPPAAPAGACGGSWDGKVNTGLPEPGPAPPPDQAPPPPPGPDQAPPPPPGSAVPPSG